MKHFALLWCRRWSPVALAPAVISLALVGCSPEASETAGSDGSGETSSSDGESTSPSSAGETSTTEGNPSGSGSTSSNSGTTDDPSAGATTEMGCDFICPTDGGVAGQCDPLTQDCPEGEKCTAVSMTEGEPWEINVCKPIMGNGQLGDECNIDGGKYTGEDNCDLGFICLLTDDDGVGGTCVEFCNASMECPLTNVACQVYNNGSLPICLFNCDPLLQDCPDGQGCYNGTNGGWVCFKQTADPGEGGQGDVCNFINQCNAGLYCANAAVVEGCPGDSGGCCTPFCDLGDPDPSALCQDAEECVAYWEEGQAPPGEENIGVCAIPA
ncbi:MAG: ribulose phosphate epimerase [Myxococcales bacterium]|nr:ribulose phosphate epimerase [Myxococcales bacterium]MCB9754032.1 ribulose phosphate epimerase [Myxococcales bacterium]